jgi:hypothetical protein
MPLQKLHINGAIRGNGIGGALRVQTDYGYLDLGAQDASYAHIYTDRSGICLNKGLFLNTGVITSLGTNEIKFINKTQNGNVTALRTPLVLTGTNALFHGDMNVNGNMHLDGGCMHLNWNRWITIGPVSASSLPLVDEPRLALHHNGVHAYVDFADNMHFRANLNWVCPLSLYGDGTVGIGFYTTYDRGVYKTQGYKLAVNGNILCEAVKVINDVPDADYVFEPDYSLMDINALERYVTEQKHLPDIPSAEEFKANGYTVGDMDEMLLRKVEELTLYLIAQNKKLETLQQELTQLKATSQKGDE